MTTSISFIIIGAIVALICTSDAFVDSDLNQVSMRLISGGFYYYTFPRSVSTFELIDISIGDLGSGGYYNVAVSTYASIWVDNCPGSASCPTVFAGSAGALYLGVSGDFYFNGTNVDVKPSYVDDQLVVYIWFESGTPNLFITTQVRWDRDCCQYVSRSNKIPISL